MLILLVAACLVWVGILSLAYVVLSGSAISTGWLVAGALMFAIVAWVLVMFREIQDSIKLHDYFATGNRVEGDLVTDEISTESRPRLGLRDRFFSGRRGTSLGRGHNKVRPRKVRSRQIEVSHSPASR